MGKPIDIIRQAKPRPQQTSSKKNSNSGVFLVIVLVLVFIGLSSSKLFESKISQTNSDTKKVTENQVKDDPYSLINEPSTEELDADNQKLKVEKQNSKIKILNATKETGVAAIIKGYLEKLGYKIESIGTIEESPRQNTIRYSANKKELATLLSKDLAEYNPKTEEVIGMDDYDLVIIISEPKSN